MEAQGGPDIAPNWETWQGEILCPRCGYDVRMLAEPRCPECGLRSTWRELTERTAYEDRTGLFEYWWRRRPVRSLVSTLWRCMFPWLLWPRISIVTRPRIGPLVALALITALLTIAHGVVSRASWSYVLVPLWARQPVPAGWRMVWRVLRVGANDGLMVGGLLLLVLLFVLLGMLVFRQSMKRYQVRLAHVVRVSALSWCGFALWSVLIVHSSAYVMVLMWPLLPPLEFTLAVRDVLPLGCLVLSIGLGWSVHLKVRRGWAVGPLVVLMSTVAMFVIVCLYTILWAASLDNGLLDLVRSLWPAATEVFETVFRQIVF